MITAFAPDNYPDIRRERLAQRHRLRLAFCRAPLPYSGQMSLPDLAPEEYAEVVRLVRAALDGDRYPLSPRAKRLKSIMAKLDQASLEHAVVPYPAPRPSAEPSLLYTKLRRGRWRR